MRERDRRRLREERQRATLTALGRMFQRAPGWACPSANDQVGGTRHLI